MSLQHEGCFETEATGMLDLSTQGSCGKGCRLSNSGRRHPIIQDHVACSKDGEGVGVGGCGGARPQR